MEDSPFRNTKEMEARRALHEAIGRFIVAFELVVAELRAACRLMLERSGLGLKNQPLANIVLARVNAAELTELADAMYREFRPADRKGMRALEPILKRIDKLRQHRNNIIHAAWMLGVSDDDGGVGTVAHTVGMRRQRGVGQTVFERSLRRTDFDELTAEATRLQVYMIRLCHSVNQFNVSLAEQFKRSL